MTKKQTLINEIFNKVKTLLTKYDDSFTIQDDGWVMNQIEQRIVSGGRKGYAFKIQCHYKEYTFYTCYGVDILAEYIVSISVSKNTINLLGKFNINKGLF